MYSPDELKNMTVVDLNEELDKSRKELFKEKSALSIGQSKTPHRKKQLQRYIARLLTAINNR